MLKLSKLAVVSKISIRAKTYFNYSFLFSPRCDNTTSLNNVKLHSSFLEFLGDILFFCLKSVFSTWLFTKPVTPPSTVPESIITVEESIPQDTPNQSSSSSEEDRATSSENDNELAVIPNRGYFNHFRRRPSPMLEIDALPDEAVPIERRLLIESGTNETTVSDYSDADDQEPSMEGPGQLPDVHNLPRNFVMPIYSASGEDTNMVMIGRGKHVRPLMPQGIFFSDDPDDLTKRIGYSDEETPRWSQRQISYQSSKEEEDAYNNKIKELDLVEFYPQVSQNNSTLALTNSASVLVDKENHKLPLVSFDAHFSRLQNKKITFPIKGFLRNQEEEDCLRDAKALLDMRSHCVTLLSRYSLSFESNREFFIKNPELCSVYIEKQAVLIEQRFTRQLIDIRTLFPIFHPRYHVLLTFIKDLRTIEYFKLNKTLSPNFPYSIIPTINLIKNLNFSRVPESVNLNNLLLFKLTDDEVEVVLNKLFKDK